MTAELTRDIATAAEAVALSAEYVTAVGKVIGSHVRNELTGARTFDEPAILLAPSPAEKWWACRIAMEEYGHHLKFDRLARELELCDVLDRPSLNVFDFSLRSWPQFVVLKALVDLAEVVLMEDLLKCTYMPLRDLASSLMVEERSHVAFGEKRMREGAQQPHLREELQQAVDDLTVMTLPFFGQSQSRNNEAFRAWGIKQMTNDEARDTYVRRARQSVERAGLKYPIPSSDTAPAPRRTP